MSSDSQVVLKAVERVGHELCVVVFCTAQHCTYLCGMIYVLQFLYDEVSKDLLVILPAICYIIDELTVEK